MSKAVSEKYIKPAGGFWAARKWTKELEGFVSQNDIECYVHQGFIDGHDELQRVLSAKDIA